MTIPGSPAATRLIRGIGRWDLVALTINGVIGAGIFGLPSRVYGLLGVYSLVSFVVCALVVGLIVVCFAEVASRFRETGGPYLFARAAFGPLVGFEVGWLIWLARLTAFAANCNLFVEYLSYFWPEATTSWFRPAIITTVVLFFTVINIVGVRNAALFSDVFTIGKLLPVFIFIAVGLFFIMPANFAAGVAPGSFAFSNSVLLLVYAFTGFEIAIIPSGEIRDPQRNLPFALLTSIGVIAVTYLLIQIVCIGTLSTLASSSRPLVDAANQFLGTAGATLITAGVLVSIAGNLSVILLAGSRLPFAMARENELPAWLGVTHSRFHTPHLSILVTAGIILVVTVSGSFIYALTISTLARLVAYMITCAALPLLRRREHELPAQFRVPGGPVVVALALTLSFWLLSNSTRREARDTLIAATVGLIVYAVHRLRKSAQ
ncbi:MAG: amino acid permease [Acidobacteriota bacterium]